MLFTFLVVFKLVLCKEGHEKPRCKGHILGGRVHGYFL